MKIEEERIIELIKACRMVEGITAARISKTTVAKGYSDIADALQELVNLRKAFEKACKYLSIGKGCHGKGNCTKYETCKECWTKSILEEVIENDE